MTRPRALLLARGYWWGDGAQRAARPVGRSWTRSATLHGRRRQVDVWTEPPADGATNPTARRAGRARRVAGSTRSARPPGRGRRAGRRAGPRGRTGAGRGADAGGAGGRRRGPHEPSAGSRRRTTCCWPSGPPAAPPATAVDVALPGHLSVSAAGRAAPRPAALARALRRPLPSRPTPYARRGTAFHAWLEQRFGGDRAARPRRAARRGRRRAPRPTTTSPSCRTRSWPASGPTGRPIEVEVPFATVVGGVVIRGRMDAVFAEPGRRLRRGRLEDRRQPAGADADGGRGAAGRVPAGLGGAGRRAGRAGRGRVPLRPRRRTVRPADLLDAAGLHALVASLPV